MPMEIISTLARILQYMVMYRNTDAADKSKPGEVVRMAPVGGLDIHLYDDSLNYNQPSEIELCRGEIMKDALGIQAARRCAQRKLNNVGYLVGHCAHVNSEENMETMRHNLMFVSTQAEINHKEAADKATKRKEVAGALEEKAPDAAKKMELNRHNISSITVN